MGLRLRFSKLAAGLLIGTGTTSAAAAVVVISPPLQGALTDAVQTVWPNRQVQATHTRTAAVQLLRAEYAFWRKQLEGLRRDARTPVQRELIESQLSRLDDRRDQELAALQSALVECFGDQGQPGAIDDGPPQASASLPKASTAQPRDVGMRSAWTALAHGQSACPAAADLVTSTGRDGAWAQFKAIWLQAATVVGGSPPDRGQPDLPRPRG